MLSYMKKEEIRVHDNESIDYEFRNFNFMSQITVKLCFIKNTSRGWCVKSSKQAKLK